MRNSIVILFFLLFSISFASTWQGVDEGFTVLSSNSDSIRIQWSSANVVLPYVRYLQRENPDIDEFNASTWIAIPRGKSPQLISITNFPINGTVFLGDPVCFRDLWMVPLSIQLVSPTLAEGNVTNGSVTIRFNNSATAPQPLTRGVSSIFFPLYKTLVPNFEDVYPTSNILLSPTVIAICPPFLQTGLVPWVNWRKSLGWNVQVVSTSTTGNTAQSMKNWLLNQYNNATNPPDAVFLIGDETIIPAFYSNTPDPTTIFSGESYPGNYIDEQYFSRLEGPTWQTHPDPMPDILLGRMLATSITDVTVQVNKIVSYESRPDTTNWYNYGIVAADQQSITQRETKRWTRQRMMDNGFIAVDSLYSVGSGSLLNGYLNQGRSLLNYRGSGWSFGWAGIGYYYTNINLVDNANKPVVVTGIGCGVGKFDDANCFGEAWMKQGTVSVSKGSVGFIGPTWNTHTQFNNVMDKGIYRMWFRSYLNGLAAGLVGAHAQMISSFAAYYPQDSNIREVLKTQSAEYVCLSDPILQVHLGRPDSIIVTAPSMFTVGQQIVSVTVQDLFLNPKPQQFVTVFDTSGINLASGWTNLQGNVTLTVNIPTNLQVVGLSVSGYKSRVQRRIIPVNQNSLFVRMDSLAVADSTGIFDGHLSPGEIVNLNLTIINISTIIGSNLSIQASTNSPHLTLLQSQRTIQSLSPAETSQVVFPVQLSQQYRGQNSIQISFTGYQLTDTIGYSLLTLPVKYPTVVLNSVYIDTSGNHRLDRSETTSIQFALQNNNQLSVPQLQIQLLSDNSYFSLSPTDISIDSLPINTIGFHTQNVTLTGSDTLPAYFDGSVRLALSSEFPTWIFRDTLSFHFIAGTIDSTAPTYVTNQPYFAYESEDSLYTASLEFDWFDISPSNGGLGTPVNFQNGNQVFPVSLPFTFQYFGQTFQSISVSTDGWIAPGVQLASSWLNQLLPFIDDGINGMICPWWDNLWGFSQLGQSCFTFYDSTNHRYLIQWDSVTVGSNGSSRLNFQFILYDENFYPTPTNDNPFDFVYKNFQGGIVYSMTVGLESPDETIGIVLGHHLNRDSTMFPFHDAKRIHFTSVVPRIRTFTDASELLQPKLLSPSSFVISKVYPNPFNSQSNITLEIPWNDQINLSIFDVLGRRVKTLYNGQLGAGRYNFTFSSIDLSSGVYYMVATSSKESAMERVVLLK